MRAVFVNSATQANRVAAAAEAAGAAAAEEAESRGAVGGLGAGWVRLKRVAVGAVRLRA